MSNSLQTTHLKNPLKVASTEAENRIDNSIAQIQTTVAAFEIKLKR